MLGYELSALTKKTDALTKALDEHTVNLADFRAKAKALTARRAETTRQANLDKTAAKQVKPREKRPKRKTQNRRRRLQLKKALRKRLIRLSRKR